MDVEQEWRLEQDTLRGAMERLDAQMQLARLSVRRDVQEAVRAACSAVVYLAETVALEVWRWLRQ